MVLIRDTGALQIIVVGTSDKILNLIQLVLQQMATPCVSVTEVRCGSIWKQNDSVGNIYTLVLYDYHLGKVIIGNLKLSMLKPIL